MNLLVIFVCVVSFIGIKSECSGSKCLSKFVNEFFNRNNNIEEVNVKIDLPNFEQVKNVEINDLNTILLQLTNWFEDKLNETNFQFKNINNETKIFVKAFDFNVDFEKGDVNIDVQLTENKINGDKVKSKPNYTVNEPWKYNKTPIISVIEKVKANDKYNEVFNVDEFDTTYYDSDEDNSTDYPIIDYIDMYKDTTNEEYVYTQTDLPSTVLSEFNNSSQNNNEISPYIQDNMNQKSLEPMCHGDSTCDDFVLSVFPWIVAIFIKDGVSSQFSYYCDGALLSDRIILTDARCVHKSNKTLDSNDILVFLGKGSLQVMNGNEKIQKIKEVIVHDNFTLGGKTSNDLALLVMEESVNLSNNIQSACVEDRNNDPVEISATTAWALNGELRPIFFNKEKSDTCYDKDENIFCATYGNDVALCPSYGGVYAVKRSEKWCLQGIFYGDPAERGICFSKNVFYTSLKNYLRWIDSVVDINKNNL